MRVLVDTTYTLRGPSGTATYLAGLVPALREAGVDVVEVANAPTGSSSTRPGPPPAGALITAADARETRLVA